MVGFPLFTWARDEDRRLEVWQGPVMHPKSSHFYVLSYLKLARGLNTRGCHTCFIE